MFNEIEKIEAFKNRTKQLALRVLHLYCSLPKTDEAMIIGRQLFRSATSVAANYRAACRSRSDAEFYSKISIVLEESDETLFWLEFLVEGEIVGKNRLDGLMKECEEIVKIVNSIRTNKRKDKLAQQTSILNLKTLTQK